MKAKTKTSEKIGSRKVERENLIEEASEIVDKCISCGMCKGLCPVFAILREEQSSPRGHTVMLKKKMVDDLMFKCTLCKACEQRCPLNLKICDAVKNAREALNLSGKQLKSNKEMVERIKKTGSPFDFKNKDPDKLYCC